MSAATIPTAMLPRVGALVRLLGSPIDGEALGAARAIGRTLQGAGVDWHALAEIIERPAAPVIVFAEPPAPRRSKASRRQRPDDVVLDAAACRQVGEALYRALANGRLSEWQTEFASSLTERMQGGSLRLSKKQGDALKRLLMKVGEVAPWA